MVEDAQENIAPSSKLQTLRVDDELIVSRGQRVGEAASVLTVSTTGNYPSAATLAQLENAYSLRNELDASWAARPVGLVQERDRLTLVLEDPGGLLLDGLVGRALGVVEFLPLAIGLTVALGALHKRGLIHMDIKPANILAELATGQVWLTGFRFCSRVRRERQAPKPPDAIAGTLAYMAPERTGRMNRSVDSRADLYSCGVTLYEMLTGQLPFIASDAMEWVHCQIARQPPPPSQRREGIPQALD